MYYLTISPGLQILTAHSSSPPLECSSRGTAVPVHHTVANSGGWFEAALAGLESRLRESFELNTKSGTSLWDVAEGNLATVPATSGVLGHCGIRLNVLHSFSTSRGHALQWCLSWALPIPTHDSAPRALTFISSSVLLYMLYPWRREHALRASLYISTPSSFNCRCADLRSGQCDH